MSDTKIRNNVTRNNLEIMHKLDAATNDFVSGLHRNSLNQQDRLLEKTEKAAKNKMRSAWFAFGIATAGVLAGAGSGFCSKTFKIFDKFEVGKILNTVSDGLKASEKVTTALGEVNHTKDQTLIAIMRDALTRLRSELDRANDSEKEILRSMIRSLEALYDAKISAMGRN